WPDEYWKELVSLATSNGLNVYLPWGNESEKGRANELSNMLDKAHVLEKSSVKELAEILMYANGVVGVDSGLAHLTAACGTPAVTIYGSTSAKLTGTIGENNHCLQTKFDCSPCLKKTCEYTDATGVEPACYQTLSADSVWNKLITLMAV
ncbi:MAG: lipopolysaccharide heptosyltransferase 1, partial [Cycloclasticus sp.]|nr:lipopolysaccharide heptosyltransferase 1 [Cycloclasticus sp.]